MQNQIDFIGKQRFFALISAALVIGSLIVLFTKGVPRGVDFAGGTKLTVQFRDAGIVIGTVRQNVEDKASIVKIDSEIGSMFAVKVKRPDVEEGQETEASQERLRAMNKAFSDITGEEAALLQLISETETAALTAKLMGENPYALTGTESVVFNRYQSLAQSIQANIEGAASVAALARAADPENSLNLERGIYLAFPSINRTTGELLSAILKKYDPLNRPVDDNYVDIANQIVTLRENVGDFFTDLDKELAGLQVREGESTEPVLNFLKNNFVLGDYKIVSNETFSPSIAAELLKEAWEAIILAMFGILLYVAFRFNRGYAIASVIALIHDVVIALGIFALVGRELSNPVVAAFLTIVGYSLNDTIVVFDRIRDNLGSIKRPDVAIVMNTSINQTLSRTLVTSLTTLFVVSVIFWFSKNPTLSDFAFPLLVGIVVGTYSSIFVASPTLLLWNNRIRSIVT